MQLFSLAKAKSLLAVTLMFSAASLFAGSEAFKAGPQIKNFGEIAAVESTLTIPHNTKFKVAFDVGAAGDEGKVNRKFNSLARFINMHVANGVKAEDIEFALVVHGKASLDLLSEAAVTKKLLGENKNIPLLKALLNNQVKVYLCGQSAAYYGVKNDELYQGVDMALSAMTAHALLQQQGYSLNPF